MNTTKESEMGATVHVEFAGRTGGANEAYFAVVDHGTDGYTIEYLTAGPDRQPAVVQSHFRAGALVSAIAEARVKGAGHRADALWMAAR